MDKYCLSNAVSVFPSTNRILYPNSKLTSENNFVNILNSITDHGHNDYVLDYESGVLKIVIHGYYFEVNISLGDEIPNLWAAIIVETRDYGQLISWNDEETNAQLDYDNRFKGLAFSESSNIDLPTWFKNNAQANKDYKVYTLQIKDNNKFVNTWKFNTDSTYLDNAGRTLTEDLSKRQYVLKAGNGIAGGNGNKGTPITNNFGENTICIDNAEMAKLTSLINNGQLGTGTTLVYFDGDGKAIQSGTTVGGPNFKTGASPIPAGVIATTDVYLDKGTIKFGRTIYAANYGPSDNKQMPSANVGDIWIKYQ